MNFDRAVDRVVTAVLRLAPGSLDEWYQTSEGRKKVRYALVSVVAVPVGTLAVLIFDVIQSSAGTAAVLGNSVGAIPSYILNRYWVWGKTDKNRLFGEVLPFWAVTLVGIGFSFFIADEAGQFTRRHDIGGVARLSILLLANLAGFGILWVAKYILFNKVLFVVRGHDTPKDRADTT